MTRPKKYAGRKAVKATVRHSIRGTASKVRRQPPRVITLVGIGAVLGAIAGWLLGRRGASAGDPFPAYQPPAPAASHSTPEAKAAAAMLAADADGRAQWELRDQRLEVVRGRVQAAVGDRAADGVVGAAVNGDLIAARPSGRQVRLVRGERKRAAAVDGVEPAAGSRR